MSAGDRIRVATPTSEPSPALEKELRALGSCQHFANRLSPAFNRTRRGAGDSRGKTAGQRLDAGFWPLSQGGDTGSNPVGAARTRTDLDGRGRMWTDQDLRPGHGGSPERPPLVEIRSVRNLSGQGSRERDSRMTSSRTSDLIASSGRWHRVAWRVLAFYFVDPVAMGGGSPSWQPTPAERGNLAPVALLATYC